MKLFTVTSGTLCLLQQEAQQSNFFSLPLPTKSSPVEISPRYDVRLLKDRMNAVICFINVIRWIEAVSNTQDLFPNYVLPLHKRVARTSPWFENDPNSASIEAHHDYVVKGFEIPKENMRNLVRMYKRLKQLETEKEVVPHTITPLKVLFNKRDLLTEQIPSKIKEKIELELHLKPIGASRRPKDVQELRSAIKCVLQFLEQFHKIGYVHRDIRWPNIICYKGEWVVIDLELACLEKDKEVVFWNNSCLPPDVTAKTAKYNFKSDLYEVGFLLREIALTSTIPDAIDLRDKLLQFQFNNATDVLKHQWLV